MHEYFEAANVHEKKDYSKKIGLFPIADDDGSKELECIRISECFFAQRIILFLSLPLKEN